MLPNEVFALACRAYYDEQGFIVDKTNGEFAHCPFPKGMGDKGYYLLWEHHQQQGLLQSWDMDRKCFWGGNVKKWLITCDYWPDNFFDLWDIYDLYVRDTTQLNSPEAKTKNIEAIKKPVKVTFPDGRAKIYPSRVSVSEELGCHRHSVSRWLKGHRKPSREFAGYSFCYV